MFFKRKEDTSVSVSVSMPKEKVVHGITVRKLPIGSYMRAMRDLETLPTDILAQLFPDQKDGMEILATLSTLDNDKLFSIISRAMVIVPEHLIKAVCSLLQVDPVNIMGDDDGNGGLSPTELMDVLDEFWHINDLSAFTTRVAARAKKILPSLMGSGSSSGSPLPKQ